MLTGDNTMKMGDGSRAFVPTVCEYSGDSEIAVEPVRPNSSRLVRPNRTRAVKFRLVGRHQGIEFRRQMRRNGSK